MLSLPVTYYYVKVGDGLLSVDCSAIHIRDGSKGKKDRMKSPLNLILCKSEERDGT